MHAPSHLLANHAAPRRRQRGEAIVEFALVALMFITLLLGIMEFGRWMFTLNAAGEATRWGARLATVCDLNDSRIKEKMRYILANVDDAQISITYAPANCDASNCKTVEVSIVNATFTPLIPFFGVALPLPAFTTNLPRELMKSTGNPVCS